MPLLKIRTAAQESASDDVRTDAAERAWVDRIRAGDMDAFESLYRTYWQRLYTFAFRYVGSKEEAEDVAQEVFYRIWRGRERWVPAGAVRGYLYLSVRNAARDRLARQSGMPQKPTKLSIGMAICSAKVRISKCGKRAISPAFSCSISATAARRASGA